MPSRPAFDASYERPSGDVRVAAIELMVMMRPAFCRIITEAVGLMTLKAPVRLTAMMRSQSSGLLPVR